MLKAYFSLLKNKSKLSYSYKYIKKHIKYSLIAFLYLKNYNI